MGNPDVPSGAELHDEKLVAWLNNRDWNHIGEHKYESVNEHWYIAQSWYEGVAEERFLEVVDKISQSPWSDTYSGTEFNYLFAEGWKYWVSASHYTPGVMLNRRPADPDTVQATFDVL